MRVAQVFLLLFFFLHFGSAAALDVPAGVKPSKRTQDFPWMTVNTWDRMHAEDVLVAQFDTVDVLFVGDSITAGWDWALWQQHFAPLKAANFGVGGDHTGNILWRLQHGTIGNLNPKVVVLLAGVNNFGHLQESPEQVAEGVAAIVAQIRLAWPESRTLLNAVLPFEQSTDSPRRQDVAKLNPLLAVLGDNKQVVFKNYGGLFLDPKGDIPAELMGDFLHPTAKGYERWAQAMLPDIRNLLQP